MNKEEEIIAELFSLTSSITSDNVGDLYVQAALLYAMLQNPDNQVRGEQFIAQIRSFASQAEVGWRMFIISPSPSRTLTDDDFIRIFTIISTLNSFCYGLERLDEVSILTGPSSTPIKFYINSIYHYIATLYLLERERRPIGGMVYKALAPMGLAQLLDQIKIVLDKPMEGGNSFGETIRRIRNDFLVHGTFSPDDISSIVKTTALHNMTQQLHLTNLIWELFNESFILKLKLISLLTSSKVDFANLLMRYIEKVYPTLFSNLPN